MKRPDENYNWDNSVGMLFHERRFPGNNIPFATPFGKILRHSKSRVYYESIWSGGEAHCQKHTICLVEVTKVESCAIAEKWAERRKTVEAADSAFAGFLDKLCESSND